MIIKFSVAKPSNEGSVRSKDLVKTYPRQVRKGKKRASTKPKNAITAKADSAKSVSYKDSLLHYITCYIDDNIHLYKPSTVKKYNVLFIIIDGYQTLNKKIYKFEDISLDWGNGLIHYLLNERNQMNTTIEKELIALFRFLRYYKEKGFVFDESIFRLKIKTPARYDFAILNESDIEKLINVPLPSKIEVYRDVFIFQLFTGQRISDVLAFKKEQLKGYTWEFYASKTGKLTRVPLQGFGAYAWLILEKYGFELPHYTEQRLNANIKEICKEAGIRELFTFTRLQGARVITTTKPKWELITTHTARRSCISLLISKGVGLPIIMKLTGHSDVKMLMKYEQNQFDALETAFLNIKI